MNTSSTYTGKHLVLTKSCFSSDKPSYPSQIIHKEIVHPSKSISDFHASQLGTSSLNLDTLLRFTIHQRGNKIVGSCEWCLYDPPPTPPQEGSKSLCIICSSFKSGSYPSKSTQLVHLQPPYPPSRGSLVFVVVQIMGLPHFKNRSPRPKIEPQFKPDRSMPEIRHGYIRYPPPQPPSRGADIIAKSFGFCKDNATLIEKHPQNLVFREIFCLF